MKNYDTFKFFICALLVIAIGQGLNAQIDTEHYIPPHVPAQYGGSSTSDWQVESIVLSTPSTTSHTVTLTDGSGAVISTHSISKGNPVEVDFTVGSGSTASSPNPPLSIPRANIGTVLTNSGLIATSSEPFYVEYRARSNRQATSYASKGSTAQGRNFKWAVPVAEQSNNLTNSIISIIAVEDATVDITGIDPATEITGVTHSGSLTVTLSAGESIIYEVKPDQDGNSTANQSGHIGADISSTGDIVVTTGGLMIRATNPTNENFQDFGLDQLVPEQALGTNYAVIGGAQPFEEDVTITATRDNTNIFLNGSSTVFTTLNEGDHIKIDGSEFRDSAGNPVSATGSEGSLLIETNEPVYVHHAIVGRNSNDPNNSTNSSLNVHPNQDILLIAPLSTFTPPTVDEIGFVGQITGNDYNDTTITAITAVGATLTIEENGTAITIPSASPITGTADYEYRKIDITAGTTVSATSNGPLQLVTGGRDNDASFGGYFSGFGTLPEIELLIGCPFDALELLNPDPTFDSYQWVLDGVDIPGETSTSFPQLDISGTYQLRVSNGVGQSELSNPIDYVLIDNDEDGFNNRCDLDDDNDGILDRDETLAAGASFSDDARDYTSKTPQRGSLNIGGETVEIAIEAPQTIVNGSGGTIDLSEGISGTYRVTIIFPEAVTSLTIDFSDFDNPSIESLSNFNILPTSTSGDLQLNTTTGEVTSPINFGTGEIIWSGIYNPVISFDFNSGSSNFFRIRGMDFTYADDVDTDGDNVSNRLDVDSDNDGIFDAREASTTVSDGDLNPTTGGLLSGENADGVPLIANSGAGFTPINTDTATNPNYINLDSDGDGCSDANEYYNDPNIDGGDGGEFGSGTPTVDSFGKVQAATYDGTAIDATRDDTQNICADPCDPISGNIDSDGDGVTDICDLDDDNDGILDTIECGSSGGSTVYATLESQSGVTDAANATGAPDGNFAEIYFNTSELILDLGQEYPAGTEYQITWKERSGQSGTALLNFAESTSANSGFVTHPTSPLSTNSQTSFVTSTVIAETNFRYLRFSKGGPSNNIDVDFDAVGVLTGPAAVDLTYSLSTNSTLVERDRNAPNDLLRDLIFANASSTNLTFDLNFSSVTPITIELTVGDQDFGIVNVPFEVNNDGDSRLMGGPSGTFQTETFSPAASSSYSIVGSGSDPRMNAVVIRDASNNEVLAQFDFGSASSPVENGYIQITSANVTPTTISLGSNAGSCSLDTDNDSVPDYLDLDSDNDGIPDNVEAQTTAGYIAPNTDNVTDFRANDGVNSAYLGGLTPVDSEGDGTPDYLDLDSDGDGLTDLEENALANNDTANSDPLDGVTGNDVGDNGLDNDTLIETADDYSDVNGLTHDGSAFNPAMADTDGDINSGGDYDYRDLNETVNLFGTRIISSLQNGTVIPNKMDAYLNIVSNNWGVVITRVAGVSAITNAVEGMIVFDTSDNTFKVCTDDTTTPATWRAFRQP